MNGVVGNWHIPNRELGDVLNRSYPISYSEMDGNDDTFDHIGCEPADYVIQYKPKNEKNKIWCLRDTLTRSDLAVYNESKVYNCFVGYANILRTRLEKAFNHPLRLLNVFCKEKRTKKTGNETKNQQNLRKKYHNNYL